MSPFLSALLLLSAPPALAQDDEVPEEAGDVAGEIHALHARIEELEARLAEMESAPRVADFPDPPEPPDPPEVPDFTGFPSSVSFTGPVEVGAGEVVEDAVAYTGPVDVAGTVLGDAVSMVSDVRVLPGGRVMGDAVSFGGSVVIEPGGEVMGDRLALGGDDEAFAPAEVEVEEEVPGPLDRAAGMLHGFARRLAVLLSFTGLGVLMVGFWPGHVNHVADLVVRRPFWYGVAGAILTSLLSLGALVFTLTVVGIPVALLLAVLLAVGWLLGVVAVCKAVGERFPAARDHGNWASFLVGAAVLTAVGMLPWVGPLLLVLVALPALGAALVSRFGSRRDPDVA